MCITCSDMYEISIQRRKKTLSLFSYREHDAEKSNTKTARKRKKFPGLLGNAIHRGLGSDEGMEEKLVSSFWRRSRHPLITQQARDHAIQLTWSNAAECEKKRIVSLSSIGFVYKRWLGVFLLEGAKITILLRFRCRGLFRQRAKWQKMDSKWNLLLCLTKIAVDAICVQEAFSIQVSVRGAGCAWLFQIDYRVSDGH